MRKRLNEETLQIHTREGNRFDADIFAIWNLIAITVGCILYADGVTFHRSDGRRLSDSMALLSVVESVEEADGLGDSQGSGIAESIPDSAPPSVRSAQRFNVFRGCRVQVVWVGWEGV